MHEMSTPTPRPKPLSTCNSHCLVFGCTYLHGVAFGDRLKRTLRHVSQAVREALFYGGHFRQSLPFVQAGGVF